MTKQEQIAAFIDRHITLPRMAAPYGPYQSPSAYSYEYFSHQRPTPEQVGHEIFQLAEFRALQLGGWLGTTDGQVLAAAVEMASPPLYRQDVELLVQGLTYAAQLQQREGQDTAGRLAFGVLVAAALIALVISASGPTAPRG